MNRRTTIPWMMSLAAWGSACLSPLPIPGAEDRDREDDALQHCSKWLEEPPTNQVKDIFTLHALEAGLPPSMAYALAIGEGLGRWLDANTTNGGIAITNKLNGLEYLGLDFFCADIGRLKQEGFIRTNFQLGRQYNCIVGTNGFGRTVPTGDFNGLDPAVEAFAACIAHARHMFNNDRVQWHLGEVDKAHSFSWTYTYLREGEDMARSYLKAVGTNFSIVPETNLAARIRRRWDVANKVNKDCKWE